MDSGAPSTDTLSPVGDLLGQLRLAVSQLRLYPEESPQVLKAVAAAYQAIAYHLADRPTLALAVTPRGLLVNGRPPRPGDAVADSLEAALQRIFREAGIRSLRFHKGLALEELLAFLSALNKKFWNTKGGKEINGRLRERRVHRVTVDEVDYVAVAEGDLVIQNAAAKLEGSGSRLAEILSTFDQVIESALEKGVVPEVRCEIVRRMVNEDPGLLERLRPRDPTSPSPDSPDFFDCARQVLGEIFRLMRSCDQETREALRSIGLTLLAPFRNRPELYEPMREFLSDGSVDRVPEWMREAVEIPASEAAAVARAKRLLTLPWNEQRECLEREVSALFPELLSLGRNDLVQQLILIPAESLADRTARRRREACQTLSGLRNALENLAADETRSLLENEVRAALISETGPETYRDLAELAAFMSDLHLRKREFAPAIPLLEALRDHHQIKKAGQPWRQSMAFEALERIAGGSGFAAALTQFREGSREASEALQTLGAAAAPGLIAELLAADNPAHRGAVAELLSRAGPDAAALFVEEVSRIAAPTDAIRILETLPLAVPDNMGEMVLGRFLSHPVPPVRRRAAAILGDRNFPHAGAMLLDALTQEEEPSVRAALVDALGKARVAVASPALCDISDSRSESDETRIAACLALSRLGDARAVPLLARLCQRGARGITRIFTPVGPGIRAAAARALGHFPGSEEAREALQKARNDPDPSVRAAASESLYASLHGAFGDLVREVQLVSAVQELKPENWKLAGSFTEIPFDQVCQLIGGSGKSGVLMINADGRVARIYFESGAVVSADFEAREDQEAFNLLARQKTGVFLFQPGEAPPRRRIRTPVTQMLLEAFRVQDETRK